MIIHTNLDESPKFNVEVLNKSEKKERILYDYYNQIQYIYMMMTYMT